MQKQNLSVGITFLSAGWKRILEQEGIRFRKVSLKKQILPRDFGAIIVSSELSNAEAHNTKKFIENSGAVLTTFEFARKIHESINFREEFARFLKPEGRLFYGSGLLWLNQEIAVFKNNEKILEEKIGKGFLIVLPFSIEKTILNSEFEKRAFFSKRAFIAEFAPKTSKSNARVVACNCIKRLFELRSLPFLHLWYYPKEFESVFCFHVDIDSYTQDALKTAKILENCGIETTWFLNMEKAGESMQIFGELLKHKTVGSHNYWHDFFDSKKNFENVMKAHKELEKFGVKAKCFCAPNGKWDNGIASAVEKLKYDFAIAFSLDCDNLPFRPILGNREAGFLVLPMHPVDIGVLKQYDFSERQMADYFQGIIERNIALNLPLLLYGHAFKRIARFPRVIEGIAKKIECSNVWKTNHFDFVRFWRRREKMRFNAFFDGKKISITTATEKNFSIAVVFCGKRILAGKKTSAIQIHELEKGVPIFRGFVRDTVPKASGFGAKYVLKKILGRIINAASFK